MSGGVVIQNWPSIIGVSSSVPLSVWNAGLVGISGTIGVNNFPATQNVSGSITVGAWGTNVTSSVQGVPGGIPQSIWSAGTIGVSGTVTTTPTVTQTAINVSSSSGLRVWNDSLVGVSGSVTLGAQISVNNFPATQAVSGTVNIGTSPQLQISNFPATQNVSGNIVVGTWGTNVTASIQGSATGIPVQIW